MKTMLNLIFTTLFFMNCIDHSVANEAADHFNQKFESHVDLGEGLSIHLKAKVKWYDPSKNEKIKYSSDVKRGSFTSDEDYPIYQLTTERYHLGEIHFSFGNQKPEQAQHMNIYAEQSKMLNLSEPENNRRDRENENIWEVILEDKREVLLAPMVYLPRAKNARYVVISFSRAPFASLPKKVEMDGLNFIRPIVNIGDTLSSYYRIESFKDRYFRLSSNDYSGTAKFVRVE